MTYPTRVAFAPRARNVEIPGLCSVELRACQRRARATYESLVRISRGSRRAASGALDPAFLLAQIGSGLQSLFAAMDWADEEIAAASRRHPGQADLLYHAFGVLTPRHEIVLW